ncbi:hypothetical protein [Alkaliphilus transvaalensis]|uniref:hypothetical protein n=1 Tax=Alkaliphilus transvaalensis TaxID=114628 RepID=UPI00047DC24D|nr:hypothetical protein [Alkaliphilus transvaalensis]
MENIEAIFALFLLGVWITYSIWYVISNEQFKILCSIIKNTFIETYKYSLNLLTGMFLIIFYLEFIIRKFISREFSVVSLMERNPINNLELVIILFLVILMIGSIIWWSNKTLKIVKENFLKIEYDNQPVTITIRLTCFFMYIIFHTGILLPMFSYGLAGVFGNPQL